MFFRKGGGAKALNQQIDVVYTDNIGDSTAWLPVTRGNWVAVNVCRSSINYSNPVASTVTKSVSAPECIVILEQKGGGEANAEAWPIDRWQNMLVATGRRVNFDGYARLRLVALNQLDGMGVSLGLQVNRTGDNGVDV